MLDAFDAISGDQAVARGLREALDGLEHVPDVPGETRYAELRKRLKEAMEAFVEGQEDPFADELIRSNDKGELN